MGEKYKLMEFVTIKYDDSTYKNTMILKAFLHFVGISYYEFNISRSKPKYHDVLINRSDAILVFCEEKGRVYKTGREIYFVNKTTENLIKDFLEKCFSNEKIGETAHEELLECFELFEKYEYTKLLCVVYTQSYLSNTTVQKAYNSYNKLIMEQLVNKVQTRTNIYKNCYYMQYAFYLAAYEIDLICRKYKFDYFIDSESVAIASINENQENKGILNYNFVKLAAKIYSNLMGELENAWKLMSNVIEKDAYDYTAWYYMGHINYIKRRPDPGIEQLNKAIEINNTDYKALYQLGYLYSLKCRQEDKAISMFENVIDILQYKLNNLELDNVEAEYMYVTFLKICSLTKQHYPRKALGACVTAKDVITKKTKIYDYLGIDYDSDEFYNAFKKSLDIKLLREEGLELALKFDLKDKALEFLDL